LADQAQSAVSGGHPQAKRGGQGDSGGEGYSISYSERRQQQDISVTEEIEVSRGSADSYNIRVRTKTKGDLKRDMKEDSQRSVTNLWRKIQKVGTDHKTDSPEVGPEEVLRPVPKE